ncbi:MAG TPA: hypothetical protein VE860_17565 [Chthoniobacterales bacterium]|jgi:hypothetical protein|nr:hypothetical protein [Chthoniobacterales bacterium]
MELTNAALAAYGGEALWSTAKTVNATISSGGFAFLTKFQRALRRLRVEVDISQPRTKVYLNSDGTIGVFDGGAVRIETGEGRVLASRKNARSLFPGGRRQLWWDRLDQLYFVGYALWNYLAFPALLGRQDVTWTAVADWSLEASFPPNIPTHCRRQRFHFDPTTALLKQHDYTAEVFGSWAKAAHVILEHRTWNGIPFAAKRRVTLRRSDGRPARWPVLVWIEVNDWSIGN